MSGTGDVVMTDVRQLSATLVLGEEMEGRFFVRNAPQELIVEVYKPYGRSVSLRVEPGAYEVRVEQDKTALMARVSVADGGRLIVDRKQFNPTTVEPTRSRGSADVLPYAVAGRHRLELRLGMWRTGENPTVSPLVGTDDVVAGLQYTRYLKENLSITFAIEGLESQVGDGAVSTVVAFPVAVRWNPLSFGREDDGIKPFVPVGARKNYSGFSMSLGLGWLFGSGTAARP